MSRVKVVGSCLSHSRCNDFSCEPIADFISSELVVQTFFGVEHETTWLSLVKPNFLFVTHLAISSCGHWSFFANSDSKIPIALCEISVVFSYWLSAYLRLVGDVIISDRRISLALKLFELIMDICQTLIHFTLVVDHISLLHGLT